MIRRRLAVSATAAAVIVVAAACGSEPPPPPAPTGPTAEEVEAQRQDSIREAETARQDSIREAEETRARETEAAATRALESARTTLTAMVFFDYDESALRSDQEAALRSKVDILRASPNVQIRIEGHADERGTAEYNLALGNRRAEAVREYFTSFGLSEDRFSILSYGEERPQSMDANESAWARNRRAEFVVTGGANQINPPE